MLLPALLPALLLSACGGGDGDAPSAAAQSSSPAAGRAHALAAAAALAIPAQCAGITGADIPASSIDVKEKDSTTPVTNTTSGARITDVSYHDKDTAADGYPATYCKVSGDILPLPNADGSPASSIKFSVYLPAPTSWNGAAVHFGGSGFDGVDFDGQRHEALAPASTSKKYDPLVKGYVVFGDDSGHQSSKPDKGDKITDGSFALNDDQAIANFGRMALKKTHEVARILIAQRYGASQTVTYYFLGTSTGGRDALAYLQRWPLDYRAAFVNQPALNYTSVRLSNVAVARALYTSPRGSSSPSWINQAQTKALQRAVLTACDTLDGADDRVISNVEACRAQQASLMSAFQQAQPTIAGWTANVPGLSAAQATALLSIQNGAELSYPLATANADGKHVLYGYNVLQGSMMFSPQFDKTAGSPTLNTWIPDRWFGAHSTIAGDPDAPGTGANKDKDASLWYPGDQWARYFVRRNALADSLTLDPINPGSTDKARIQVLSQLTDASSANLDLFFHNGGKLILMHGLADEVVSTRSTIDYFKRLSGRYPTKLRSYARFYTVPGMGHGKGRFMPTIDMLGVLVQWAGTAATAPEDQRDAQGNPALIVKDEGGYDEFMTSSDGSRLTSKGTRPLCEYPMYPHKASASSDIKLAASYTCTTPAP